MKLKYCSIGSTNYFPDFFYKKLDKIVEYYHFGNYNKGNVKNYVDVNDKSTFIKLMVLVPSFTKELLRPKVAVPDSGSLTSAERGRHVSQTWMKCHRMSSSFYAGGMASAECLHFAVSLADPLVLRTLGSEAHLLSAC